MNPKNRYLSGTALIFILVGMTACTEGSLGDQATYREGWSARQYDQTVAECERPLSAMGSSATFYSSYCTCITSQVAERWTYSEMQGLTLKQLSTPEFESFTGDCMAAAELLAREEFYDQAEAAGMPYSLLGVRLRSTHAEVLAVRENVVSESNSLIERAVWNANEYEVSFNMSPNGGSLFMIALERDADQNSFFATNEALVDQFGPLPEAAARGPWALATEKEVAGVKLFHALGSRGGNPFREVIMLSASGQH